MPRYQVTLDGKTFVVEGDRPPTEDEARQALSSYTPPDAPKASAAPQEQGFLDRMLADNPALPAMLRGTQALARGVKAHPVTAGALAGGLVAAPFTGGTSIPAAMAASGLGAAGGAGIGSIASAAMGNEGGPETAGDVARTMAMEGAGGAIGAGVGGGLQKGLKLAAHRLYKGVLRPSMGLQREFDDVAAKGLKEGARVSDAGAAKVQGRLSANSAKAKQMIADAEAGGASPVDPREVASEFGDVFQQGRRQAQLGRPDPRPAVVERLKTFGARNPQGIPLGKAQELKGEAQDLASRAYRAADRGGPMTDLSAEADKAMARGLKGGIEKRVPGIKPVNADSQELIGLSRALEDASFRNVPGVGVIQTLLGNFAPASASAGAIGMDRAARVPFGDALKTALIAALGGGQ